jgi:hypothetical protein
VLAADDVIDLVAKTGVVLVDAAVLATISGSLCYLDPNIRRNVTGHW